MPSSLPRRYKAGQQVFLCYGRHTNLELLQHYGFVLADSNPHDVAALPPRLLPPAVQQQLAGSGADAAAADLPGCAAEDGAAAALLHASGAPSWQLLRALRLGCATPAERKASAYLALSDRPISAASEQEAFEALRAACQAALQELPTTIAQDEAELAAAAAGEPAAGAMPASGAAAGAAGQQQQQQQQQAGAERMRLAIEWRLCHKRILQRGAELCGAVLAALPAAASAPAADVGSRIAALQRRPRW